MMKVKLFDPTLPVTIIVIVGIAFFIYSYHKDYTESHKQQTATLISRIQNFVSNAQEENEQLIHLLRNKWSIIDNVSTRNMDLLVDEIQPYYNILNYDLINIYDATGELLVRADKPEIFGIMDELSNHVKGVLHSNNIEKLVIDFEGKFLLVSASRIENNYEPNGVIVAGRFITPAVLKQLYPDNAIAIELILGNKIFISPDKGKNNKLIETWRRTEVFFPSQDIGKGQFAARLFEDISATQQNYWASFITLSLIFILGGAIIISISKKLVVLNSKLERARREFAEKDLQDSHAQIRLLLNSTAEAIYGIDTTGNCTFANQACLRMLGYDNEQDLCGKNMHELIHHTRPDGSLYPVEECHIYQAFRDGKGAHVEDEVLWRADGSHFPAEYWSYPIHKEDQVVGSVVTFVDITERKRTEEELAKYREHLEELVVERTAELSAAHEKLLRKERLATLGQLTATVSHELRNPLGTLRNSLFNVSEKVKDKKLGVDKSLARMERSISRCDKIISEMLDFARAHAIKLKSVVIDDWLSGLLDELTPPQNVAVNKHFAVGVSLEIDSERLRRAIINVFDNACQALSELPETTKRVREINVRTAVEDTRLLITIADNGPGIAGDVLTHIFEPLYSTKGFGVGLGLPIVKQILEQHGGGVDISSEAGQGTQVILWFPLVGKE